MQGNSVSVNFTITWVEIRERLANSHISIQVEDTSPQKYLDDWKNIHSEEFLKVYFINLCLCVNH